MGGMVWVPLLIGGLTMLVVGGWTMLVAGGWTLLVAGGAMVWVTSSQYGMVVV